MNDWIGELRRGQSEAAWDLFVGEYRRLLFATIRHYVRDHDDVMDVFAYVCEALRAHDLRKLRAYVAKPSHTARFTTWLVTVVRHLAVDWLRRRDGRRGRPPFLDQLTPLQREIFRHVFLEARSHVECFEIIKARHAPNLTFHQFLIELRRTFRAARAHHPTAMPRVDEALDPMVDLAGDTSVLLQELLSTLGSQHRLAVEMYVIDGLPASEVARLTGLATPKAVYNVVYRALAMMREALERAGIGREDL